MSSHQGTFHLEPNTCLSLLLLYLPSIRITHHNELLRIHFKTVLSRSLQKEYLICSSLLLHDVYATVIIILILSYSKFPHLPCMAICLVYEVLSHIPHSIPIKCSTTTLLSLHTPHISRMIFLKLSTISISDNHHLFLSHSIWPSKAT